MKLRIIYDKEKCIGAANCESINPENFKVEHGKANLLKSKEVKNNIFTLDIECTEEEAKKIIEAGNACPSNAIGVKDLIKNKDIVTTEVSLDEKYEEVEAKYDDSKEFVLDSEGYFLIRVDREKKLIEIGFCKARNIVEVKITGKKPIDIYQTIIKKGLISRMDHAAYLGRELQKAYIALQQGIEYVQDDELDFNKKVK